MLAIFIILAIIGIIYGALVAMVQPDIKRLVAYSSVSHMGFVILGMFSFTELGMQGALYSMLTHGISTGALFLLVGFIYERRHTRADHRIRRFVERDADLRDDFCYHDDVFDRSAFFERFRRRVFDYARNVEINYSADSARQIGITLRRCLPERA